MADVYQYWRSACKGSTDGVPLLPTIYPPPSNDNPQAGLWKTKVVKDGPFVPVRIWLADDAGTPVHVWRDGLALAATIDGKPAPLERIERVWHFLKPVTKDEMAHYAAHAEWPGDAPTLAKVGDNSKNYGEGFGGIEAEITDYANLCREFLAKAQKAGGIKTKVDADQASNMADAIGDVKGGLARKADEMRDSEVRPHLEAQKTINTKFKPLIETGKDVAKALRLEAAKWAAAETARRQAIADAEAKKARDAAEAKAKADREAWEREQAAARRAAPADTAVIEAPPPAAAPVIIAEKVKVHVGGQRGAKRSLKTVSIAVVTDHAAALAYFATVPEIVEAVQKLCQRAVDHKMPLPPGVSVTEETRL